MASSLEIEKIDSLSQHISAIDHKGHLLRGGNGRNSPVYQKEKQDLDSLEVETHLVPVSPKNHLGYLSTYALILNKTVGTGIYTSPQVVLAATGSKGISLIFWIAGCVVTWGGLYLYLEYGMRWPVTGGELYYIDYVWGKKPFRLFTYIFASMFILINGVQANALTFGKEVVLAARGGEGGSFVDPSLQKFLAVVIITVVCQLQAYSRFIYVKLSNLLAVYKIILLSIIAVIGFLALGGIRVQNSATIQTPYGMDNMNGIFEAQERSLYNYSLALLNVMRAFLGYENANFVLHEVRKGPGHDVRRTFRRAVKISVLSICTFYITANVAFFAACTTEEIVNAPDLFAIFLQKVFGKSLNAYTASSVLVSLSAVGALMSLTFANVRVKQEIAKMGLVPVGEFWSGTSHRRTPAHALFLHWIFSVICIVITPLDNADGFLIMSTFYSYIHTYISIMLGCALLAAPWLSSFRYAEQEDSKFRPQSTSLGWWLLTPLTIVYTGANTFVLVLSWFPPDSNPTESNGMPTLPYYTGPVAGVAVIAFGVVWWAWDRHLLPALGYHFSTGEEFNYSSRWDIEVLKVRFHRELDGPARWMFRKFRPLLSLIWKQLNQDF